jgi:type I restriction enzyme M protein
MLIAGDGRAHVFRANSLDPRDWFRTQEGEALRTAVREANLLGNKPPAAKLIKESEAWDYFSDLKFDLILTNPPFAGEIRDRELLRKYHLAEKALARKSRKGAKEERDVLFIERCIHMLKPGGRMAIILPQGKFNNASHADIRRWLLRQARLIGVVGLHPNTFKPHTGTKTSVLLLSKYTEEERQKVEDLVAKITSEAPDYRQEIQKIVNAASDSDDIEESQLPDVIADALVEKFSDIPVGQDDNEAQTSGESNEQTDVDSASTTQDIVSLREEIEEKNGVLHDLSDTLEAIKVQKKLLRVSKKDTEDVLEEKLAKSKSLDETQAKLVFQHRTAMSELKDLERRLSLLTTKGRLQLLADDDKAISRMTEAWVTAKLARKLHYPVFMAASQKGGKDSSGEYEYRVKDGNVLKDATGNPLIAQDCVSYIQGEDGIAEAFGKWAKKHELPFWKEA